MNDKDDQEHDLHDTIISSGRMCTADHVIKYILFEHNLNEILP